ncbi:50S ribosomal protein L23 [Candidatus Uhrbacteria bacterium]|nr:50S ribosomal protein L23 [Candidatus Uhrbacteria bacterium]
MGFPFFGKKKEDTGTKKQEPQASTLVLRDEHASDHGAEDVKKDVAPLQRSRTVRKFPVSEQKVILRPVMSGKAFTEGRERYIFEVAKTAGKVEIKKAFYNIYGVMPTRVRTQQRGSRDIRFGNIRGQSKAWKKAIITLKKGETIHIV